MKSQFSLKKLFAERKQEVLIVVLILLFSIPAIVPLFHKGFFVSDDGEWMIIRFSAFHEALVHGQVPVRFLPRLNFEYGYPVANFLYPGFMYFSEPIHLLKFSFVNTIKIVFGLSLIGSFVFTYLWLTRLFSRWDAFVGGFVCLYIPYHLYDVYKRGSMGEVLALTVVPFIFWSIERRSFLFSTLGIAFLILSHNTLAVLFLPIIVLYLLLRGVDNFHKKMLPASLILLLGFGLSAFFWLPAIADLRYTVFSQTKVSEWQYYFSNLSVIGVSSICLLFFAILLFIFKKLFSKRVHFISLGSRPLLFVYFMGIGLGSLFFSSSWSSIFWKVLPVSFIQFPFRFLSIEVLSVSFISAYVISMFPNKKRKVIVSIIAFLIIFSQSIPYLTNMRFVDKSDGFYSTNEDTTTVKNEYMPKWVKVLPTERPVKKVDSKEVGITNLTLSPNKITFTENTNQSAIVTVNVLYFPGWGIKEDGKALPISYNNPMGVMTFIASEGTHNIQVSYHETPIHLLADSISLFCLFAMLIINNKKKNLID